MNTRRTSTLCLVEDDSIMGESLVDRLALEGIACDWYRDGRSARDGLHDKRYAALVSDIRLPDLSGEELFRGLIEDGAEVPPALFITGYGSIAEAVRLLRLGARDYITKPFDLDDLLGKLRALAPELFVADEAETELPVMGASGTMRRLQAVLATLAQHRVATLITGESGVGKEFAARFLHQESDPDGVQPFQAVNCGAVPADLLEAELFGYRRGAFTGAVREHRGVFERADHGTLLLDEIAEMPPAMQVKLLRVLQDGVVERIGAETPVAVDVRVVCATHRPLRDLVEKGGFREDLFFRINVAQVHIPPLRERPEDIIWFARRFARELGERGDRRLRLTAQAEEFLRNQPWPGNVRQLHHAIERASIFASADIIGPEHLRDAPITELAPAGSSIEDLRSYLERCEKNHIADALDDQQWQIGRTADALGISRKSLWEKMRKHALAREE